MTEKEGKAFDIHGFGVYSGEQFDYLGLRMQILGFQ